MELRDSVGLGSLVLGLLTFGYNWLKSRRWHQKTEYRDELVRFAEDPHVTEVFTDQAREDARRAAAFLSLELAEMARRSAVRLASRATSGFTRAVLGYGIGTLLLVVLFVAATVLVWAKSGALENAVSVVYFGASSVAVIIVYVNHIRKLLGIRAATGELKTLHAEIVKAKPLTERDAKLSRPRGGG